MELNIAEIKLNQNRIAIIDKADYDTISQYTWHIVKGHTTDYAATKKHEGNGKYRTIYMHRLILGLNKGDKEQGDHINHNGLDNRRGNLRKVTAQQNSCNNQAQGGSSKYRGVYWNKRDKGWQAYIYVNGKNKNLGLYKDERSSPSKR